MSDAADRADGLIADQVGDAIAHARHAQRARALEPCGVCHWCGEPLHLVAGLYCDAYCAQDHADDVRRNTGKRL